MQNDQELLLSQIIGKNVILRGKKIGKLADIIIVEKKKVPEASFFYVSRSFGNPSLLIPWENVRLVSTKETVINISSIIDYENDPKEEDILLKDHILDKKILDTEDREVEIVYDVKLVLKNNKLYVTSVDLSKYKLLSRMGLKFFADIYYKFTGGVKDESISWAYIQPLSTDISRFSGDVKLNVLKEKLSDIYPVDLADILEELDPEQRLMLFNQLENGHAVDTLEEISPNVQRVLISSLSKEKVVFMVNKMTSGQAADLLSVISFSEAKEILKLVNEDLAKKIRAILERQEERILNYATNSYITAGPDKTDGEMEDEYPKVAKHKEIIEYIYILGEEEKLLGVVNLRRLLQARSEDLLRDIMTDNIVSLNPKSTLKEALAMFSRYEFRALPITDKNDKLLGAITYRDIKNLKHRFLE
jgi:magnesium transporter